MGGCTVCVMWLPEMWRLPWVETGKGGHPSSHIMTKELVLVSLLSEAQAWFWVLFIGKLQNVSPSWCSWLSWDWIWRQGELTGFPGKTRPGAQADP